MTDAGPDPRALRAATAGTVAAPDLAYRPPAPARYRPRIGMIGTGGIAAAHLDAYRAAGWQVAALWNRTRARAEARAAEFCPAARVHDDWRAILADPAIDVVDIALPPEPRAEVIRAALTAGKHVLSQKPFVTDLDTGEALAALAEDRGLHLAVNQNGRWAPHMAWMRAAVRAGLVGEVIAVHLRVHWNHGWTAGTPFDALDDLVLFDFGIHWFDFLSSLVGARAESVFATATRARGQANRAPLLAQALVRLDGGQASVVFDGALAHGAHDASLIAGTHGTLRAEGPDLGRQQVSLTTAAGTANPALEGTWFNDGFRGAMGELLCAIEERRPPENNARDNLRALALAFAAVESRATGREVAVGAARRLRG